MVTVSHNLRERMLRAETLTVKSEAAKDRCAL